jgi:hypothetical protein
VAEQTSAPFDVNEKNDGLPRGQYFDSAALSS